MSGYLELHVACGSHDEALKIARALVEAKLAACANIIPEIRSIYRWNGEVQDDSEALLLIKAKRENYAAIEQSILKLHSYELPEITSFEIASALPAYLAWIDHESLNLNGGGI